MKTDNLPDGIEFDGHVYWCRCPECGEQQGDMGNMIRCENCGYGPMPTMDGVEDDEESQPKAAQHRVEPTAPAAKRDSRKSIGAVSSKRRGGSR